MKAFEIDERTFYAFDDEGHMLDDDLGEDEEEKVGGCLSMGTISLHPSFSHFLSHLAECLYF